VRLAALELEPLEIPFRAAFRHASAERSRTETVWVRARSSAGSVGHGEGCPRRYVTGEDLASAAAFFARHREALLGEIAELADVARYAAQHEAEIDRNPAAWCAIELALLDVLARDAHLSVEGLLGLPELSGTFRYSAVVDVQSQQKTGHAIERYLALGIRDFKLKLGGELELDRARVAALLARRVPDLRLRLDANNLWRSRDVAARYLAALDAPAFALEEPLAAGALDELAALAAERGVPIILDESCARAAQLSALPAPAERWIVNLRVSKMGGLMRALRVVDAARARGIRLIVGAQVGETSLLTRAALPVAARAGDLLLAQEGAFGGVLLAEDPCTPELRFGHAGALAFERPLAPGWGLEVRSASPRS
jgi:L-alanine-DL-glutamate epimerase-like enolase superfamily enzyme